MKIITYEGWAHQDVIDSVKSRLRMKLNTYYKTNTWIRDIGIGYDHESNEKIIVELSSGQWTTCESKDISVRGA